MKVQGEHAEDMEQFVKSLEALLQTAPPLSHNVISVEMNVSVGKQLLNVIKSHSLLRCEKRIAKKIKVEIELNGEVWDAWCPAFSGNNAQQKILDYFSELGYAVGEDVRIIASDAEISGIH